MAKKKQSKTSWRKRGAPLEDAALQARRQANQERRTGGSMAGLSDSALFDLQPRAGVPKAVIGHRRAPTGDASSKTLWVDRAVAPNKHVPTVVKGQTPTTRETALTGQKRMLKSKIAKVAKGLTQQRAQRALATAAAAAANDSARSDAGTSSRGPSRPLPPPLTNLQHQLNSKVEVLDRRMARIQAAIQELSSSMWHATHNRDEAMRRTLQERWLGLHRAEEQLKVDLAKIDVERAAARAEAERAAAELAAEQSTPGCQMDTSALPVADLLVASDASSESDDQVDWAPHTSSDKDDNGDNDDDGSSDQSATEASEEDDDEQAGE